MEFSSLQWVNNIYIGRMGCNNYVVSIVNNDCFKVMAPLSILLIARFYVFIQFDTTNNGLIWTLHE